MPAIEIEDEGFLAITIRGKEIHVDPYKAGDQLSEIDRRHEDDPILCKAKLSDPANPDKLVPCGAQWTNRSHPREPGQRIRCPQCGSQDVAPDQSFLDDVVTLLVEQYGTPPVTRKAAAQFYEIVCGQMRSLKKKSSQPVESPTGTELTPADGAA
jgi:hypothetical protein